MRERDPVLTGLLLGLYVVPLVAAVGLLLLASLPRLAVALVVVELAVSAAIAVARPGTTPRKQDPDAGATAPWNSPHRARPSDRRRQSRQDGDCP